MAILRVREIPQWIIPAIIAIFSLIFAGYKDRESLGERLTAIEVQQKVDSSPGGRLDRIEAKVDRLLVGQGK